MDPSTTPADNPTNSDVPAENTTTTDPNTGTDNQPANTGDNLEDTSKSTEPTADGDNKPADGAKDDTPASQFDEDLDGWIEKRNLAKPENDEQRQAYQDLRNSQREFTREQQAKREAADAKALSDEMQKNKPETKVDDDEADPLEKDVKALQDDLKSEKVTRLQSEFYIENKITSEEHKAILDIYKEKTTKPTTEEGKKAAYELWSSPDALSDLLDLARARILKATDTSAVEDEAARKERERIAKESNANSPGRGAKNPTTGAKTPEQERLERFTDWDKK